MLDLLNPAPTLVNGGMFLRAVRDYKVLWLDGRYGGGKTLLAFYIAREIVRRGDARYICANIPSVWNDGLETVMANVRSGQYLDTVLILDEAGLFLDNAGKAKSFNSFLRKYNVTLLLLSVQPPANILQRFSLYREINWSAFGLPVWQYKATLKTGHSSGKANKDMFRFYLTNPQAMFGLYDTEATPTDAEAINNMIKEHLVNVEREKGKGNVQLSTLEGGWRESDYLLEAAERQAELISFSEE